MTRNRAGGGRIESLQQSVTGAHLHVSRARSGDRLDVAEVWVILFATQLLRQAATLRIAAGTVVVADRPLPAVGDRAPVQSPISLRLPAPRLPGTPVPWLLGEVCIGVAALALPGRATTRPSGAAAEAVAEFADRLTIALRSDVDSLVGASTGAEPAALAQDRVTGAATATEPQPGSILDRLAAGPPHVAAPALVPGRELERARLGETLAFLRHGSPPKGVRRGGPGSGRPPSKPEPGQRAIASLLAARVVAASGQSVRFPIEAPLRGSGSHVAGSLVGWFSWGHEDT